MQRDLKGFFCLVNDYAMKKYLKKWKEIVSTASLSSFNSLTATIEFIPIVFTHV